MEPANNGRFHFKNLTGGYLRFPSDVDLKKPKDAWMVTGKDPLPDGWRVEIDKDFKEAFRYARFSCLLRSARTNIRVRYR